MSPVVVADAGPLIGLARAEYLEVLRDLYLEVWVPPTVLVELSLEENRPGSRKLRAAFAEGWLSEVRLAQPIETGLLVAIDPGEAEAIQLAGEVDLRFLLIDDRRGRRLARRRGIAIVGSGGVLLAAKEKGLIDRVAPVLADLARNGYRLSKSLRNTVLRMANESED